MPVATAQNTQVYLLIHMDILQKQIWMLLTAFVLFTQTFSSFLCIALKCIVVWFPPTLKRNSEVPYLTNSNNFSSLQV